MKAIILLANGFEEVEAIAVYDILKRADIPTTLLSITDSLNVVSTHGLSVTADLSINDFNQDFDLIFIPGGMPGSANLAENDKVKALVKEGISSKLVASICAAPSLVLAKNNLVNGYYITCYPGFEYETSDVNFIKENLVVCKNLLTAKSAMYALDLGLEIVKILKGEELSNKIRNSIK